MQTIQQWRGSVDNRDDAFDQLHVAMTLEAGPSWSAPFRAVATDGQQWFVKALEAAPAGQAASLAVEQVVAKVGRLIGAPVCEVSLIVIGPDVAGYEPQQGRPVAEGIAHASRVVPHVVEVRGAPHGRTRDDNPVRHVGCFALYDWCFGGDDQWLHDTSDDYRTWSHDHGLYLMGTSAWSFTQLSSVLNTPNTLNASRNDLSADEKIRVANALTAVKAEDIIEVLNAIPASWPIANATLEEIGWFLFNRAPGVAQRTLAL